MWEGDSRPDRCRIPNLGTNLALILCKNIFLMKPLSKILEKPPYLSNLDY